MQIVNPRENLREIAEPLEPYRFCACLLDVLSRCRIVLAKDRMLLFFGKIPGFSSCAKHADSSDGSIKSILIRKHLHS